MPAARSSGRSLRESRAGFARPGARGTRGAANHAGQEGRRSGRPASSSAGRSPSSSRASSAAGAEPGAVVVRDRPERRWAPRWCSGDRRGPRRGRGRARPGRRPRRDAGRLRPALAAGELARAVRPLALRHRVSRGGGLPGARDIATDDRPLGRALPKLSPARVPLLESPPSRALSRTALARAALIGLTGRSQEGPGPAADHARAAADALVSPGSGAIGRDGRSFPRPRSPRRRSRRASPCARCARGRPRRCRCRSPTRRSRQAGPGRSRRRSQRSRLATDSTS